MTKYLVTLFLVLSSFCICGRGLNSYIEPRRQWYGGGAGIVHEAKVGFSFSPSRFVVNKTIYVQGGSELLSIPVVFSRDKDTHRSDGRIRRNDKISGGFFPVAGFWRQSLRTFDWMPAQRELSYSCRSSSVIFDCRDYINTRFSFIGAMYGDQYPSTFRVLIGKNLKNPSDEQEDSKDRNNESGISVQSINPVVRWLGAIGCYLLIFLFAIPAVKSLIDSDCWWWCLLRFFFFTTICFGCGVATLVLIPGNW